MTIFACDAIKKGYNLYLNTAIKAELLDKMAMVKDTWIEGTSIILRVSILISKKKFVWNVFTNIRGYLRTFTC